jgi:hypothetical protein
MTTSNALLIPDLSANTDYKYLIMAGNTGATGVSAVQSFRTSNQEMAPIPDNEKVIFSDIKSEIVNSYSVTITWKTNIPTASKVSYRPTKPCVSDFLCDMDRSQYSKDVTTSHSLSLPLYPADTYTYHIEAQLSPSKPIQKSETLTVVTTDPVIDVPPIPVVEPDPIGDTGDSLISDVKVDQITNNSAVISWITNQPSYSNINYSNSCAVSVNQGLPQCVIESLKSETEDSIHHVIKLTDLQPATRYTFSFDIWIIAKMVQETSAVYNFTTLAGDGSSLSGVSSSDREKLRGGTLAREKNRLTKTDASLVNKLRGRLLLQTEEKGEAWYVDPVSGRRFYMQDGAGAYEALRSFGLGISNKDLEQIPVGVLWDDALKGDIDSDHDGLADKLESALGTDPYNTDSDNDSYTDGQEVRNGYSPLGSPKMKINTALVKKMAGRILIQADHKGEAWYVNPVDGHRYFLGNGDQAYQLMRKLALGISNSNLNKIPVGN